MATVSELLEQHNKCIKAKAALDDANLLHPAGALAGTGIDYVGEELWAIAYKRMVTERDKMRAMMKESTPEAVEEAKKIARGA